MNGDGLLEAGAGVVADSVVVEGAAAVDESAITGESAPVVREARPGRNSLLAGARILSGWVRVRPMDVPVLPAGSPSRAWVPGWWPALALGIGMAVFLLPGAHGTTGVTVGLLPPYLLLLALGAGSALQRVFWRRTRVVPLGDWALDRAARCDALVVPAAAVREDGSLVAVEFWPLPGVSLPELAGAARQASMQADGGPGRSVVILAKHRTGRLGAAVREPTCGSPEQVARHVATLGGAWPEEGRALERAIGARGGQCLAVSDGGRPLGVVELRPSSTRPSLDDVACAGMALSLVDDPGAIAGVVQALHDQGRKVAVGLEIGMPQHLPPEAEFVMAGPAWAAAHPTALDLDADPAKLPEVLLGARAVRRQARTLVAIGGLCDAGRVVAVLAPAALRPLSLLAVPVLVLLLVQVLHGRGQVTWDGSRNGPGF